MTSSSSEPKPMSQRAGWGMMGTGAAGFMALLAFQDKVMIPPMIEEVRQIMERQLDKHEAYPHRGAVTKEEATRMEAKLDRILDGQSEIRDRLTKLEAQNRKE